VFKTLATAAYSESNEFSPHSNVLFP